MRENLDNFIKFLNKFCKNVRLFCFKINIFDVFRIKFHKNQNNKCAKNSKN